MKHPPERDWMIVAPWWQWPDPEIVPPGHKVKPNPAKGRSSVPVFQKYDSPNLVNDFIKDPQHCLKFVDEDLVHALTQSPPPSLSNRTGSLGNKLLRIGAFWQQQKGSPNLLIDQQYKPEYLPDGSSTRKIFLNTHKRFYLVVCQIHCDGPGFPKAARSKICKAGFVVRRRTTKVPSCGMAEVKPIMKSLSTGRAQLARVTQLAEIESAAFASSAGQGGGVKNAKLESLLKTRTSLQALVDAEKLRFDNWVQRFKVVPQLQGWFKSPQGFDKLGCWGPVDETPSDLGLEDSFPLYPLIPDQGNDPNHAGNFGTIYFGILPTGSHDCDSTGHARFDDQEFYEVRCWVERHLDPHDPDQPCRCPDGIFWSLPTRAYKLASHFDLTGTSHQPVTIQLPDLNELAAQAKPTLGVGLAKPPGSLMFSVDKDFKPHDQRKPGGQLEICFFPIPLITIVATFVFELFLPIIMFVFQLWWMLALKFCISPELDVAAGVNAELAIKGGLEFDIDANLNVGTTMQDLEAVLETALTAVPATSPDTSLNARFGADAALQLQDEYSPIALANLELQVNGAADPARAGSPSTAANLEFEAEVTHA
jgi:hypothetical protein